MELYQWQKDAYKLWKENNYIGIIEAVTGAGKTQIGIEAIREHLKLKWKIVILVPYIVLLNQWEKEIKRNLSEEFPEMKIGTWGNGYSANINRNDILIIISHIACNNKIIPYDRGNYLLIADECHRYGSEKWSQSLEDGFNRRLGITATLERSDEGLEKKLLPFFKQKLFTLSYKEALRQKSICNFKIAFIKVKFTDDEERKYKDFTKQMLDFKKKLEDRGVIEDNFAEFIKTVNICRNNNPDMYIRYLAGVFFKYFSDRKNLLADCRNKFTALSNFSQIISKSQRSILFSQTKATAEKATEILREQSIRTAVLHSGMDLDFRNKVFADFERGMHELVAAPLLLDEGVNIPTADLAIILSSSKSKRQMIQRMGRVLRKDPSIPGKIAKIIIFFIEGTSEDPEKKEDFWDLLIEAIDEDNRKIFSYDDINAINNYFNINEVENDQKLIQPQIPYDYENELIKLILNIEKDEIKKILNPNLNYKLLSQNEDTLLMFATKQNKIEIAELLLKEGASTILQNITGQTCLHYAVENDNARLTDLYIRTGMDLDLKDADEKTPLFIAYEKKNYSIMKLLLNNGADVDIQFQDGKTLLMKSIEEKEYNSAKLLLLFNPDLKIEDNSGKIINEYFDSLSEMPNIKHLSAEHYKILSLVSVADEIFKDVSLPDKSENNFQSLASTVETETYAYTEYIVNQNEATSTDDDINIHLISAIKDQNQKEVDNLISKGADVNYQDKNKMTPLIYASKIGNFNIIQTLIFKKAEIEKETSKGNTALLYACNNKHYHAIKYLLNKGADSNHYNQDNIYPLHLACKNDDKRIVAMLLEYGAKINVEDKNKRTPLFYAIEVIKKYDSSNSNDIYDIILLLLEKGAKVNSQDINGDTPLLLAIKYKMKELIFILLNEGAKIDIKNHEKKSAIDYVLNISNTDKDIEKGFLKRILGESYNALENLNYFSENNSDHPLHLAIKNNENKVATILIKEGVYLNDINNLFLISIENDNNDISKILFKKGANVNYSNDNNENSLIIASRKGNKELINLVIEKIEDVNQHDRNSKRTALMHILYSKNIDEDYMIEVIDILHQKNADLNQKGPNNMSALEIAERIPLNKVSKHIKEKTGKRPNKQQQQTGVDVNNENIKKTNLMFIAFENGNANDVRILIEQGADVNAEDSDRNSALIYAVRYRAIDELVKMILNSGANVNHQNNSGETALLLAVKNKDDKITEILLESGANPSLVNKQGDAALTHAVKSGYKGIAELLIKHGADVDFAHKRTGRTALMDACDAGQIDMVKLLLKHNANAELKDKSCRNALVIAIEKKNTEIAEHLLENGVSSDKQSLLLAAEKGDIRLFKLLNVKGMDIKQMQCNLHDAISINNPCGDYLAEILLKNNADLTLRNDKGDTPLIAAVRNDNLRVVELIAPGKESIDIPDAEGYSPLIIALKKKTSNGKKTVEILLDNGALINIHDKSGNSPLHLCIDNNYICIAEKLIDKGALLNAANNYGELPLHKAAEKGNVNLIWKLLPDPENINTPCKNGNSLLSMCIEKVKEEKDLLPIVKEFIKRKADVNLRKSGGDTPLQLARSRGIKSVIDELVKAGANNINVNSTSGDTRCEGGLPYGVV